MSLVVSRSRGEKRSLDALAQQQCCSLPSAELIQIKPHLRAEHFALDNGTRNAFRKGYKPLDSGNFAGATKPPLTPEHLGRLDLPTLLQARQS